MNIWPGTKRMRYIVGIIGFFVYLGYGKWNKINANRLTSITILYNHRNIRSK